jgi:cytochrome c-type biogenesis protein
MLQSMLTAFIFGLLGTTSPCVLPLYPGYLAYLGSGRAGTQKKNQFISGLFVLFGVLVMMLILGALIAGLSISIGRALSWIVPLVDLIIIALGILLIANINPFEKIPMVQSPVVANPLLSAFLYGFLYGPLTLPCSGPLVVGIFAYSFTTREAFDKLAVFIGFGLGFGLPLLVISILSGLYQRKLVLFFAHHSRIINLAAGLLLVGVGIFDLASNWDMLLLFWRTGIRGALPDAFSHVGLCVCVPGSF